MKRLIVLLILLAATACTSQKAFTSRPSADATATATPVSTSAKPARGVLLMAPDVQLSELTAAGLLEPKADWTAAARAHIDEALNAEMARRNARLVHYQEPATDLDQLQRELQLIKLHGAVGGAILTHHYNQANRLPTKDGAFAWTLGEGVKSLKQRFDADYVLFILIRDSYSSAGRAALMLGLALFGVGVSGGHQVGFASLVDLSSGAVVWFNRIANSIGDLRTAEPASRTVAQLLREMPL